MTVACPDCRSVFRVDPAKVPATGVRARCSVCGGVIAISGGTLPIAVTPASSRAVAHAFTSASSSPTPRASTVAADAGLASVATPTRRPFTPVVASVPPSSPPPAAHPSTVMTPPMPVGLSSMPREPALSSGSTAPTAAMPPIVPGPRASTSSTVQLTPAAGRRSINPFLNADPGLRARRLARALVSDLVAYHPQKREEGLRDGTLRQLFREEIKKSYEEFVEQVGRDIAESSPHFQDALNDILGGGRKLF